jgi:hypothetical protein
MPIARLHRSCRDVKFWERGRSAPTRLQAVEEVLTVLDGKVEIWIDDERDIAFGRFMPLTDPVSCSLRFSDHFER